MAAQPVLLFESACSCGAGLIAKAGLCLVCYRRDWHSKKYFGGFRDEVLERDGYRCRVCSRGTRIVHHRRQLQDPHWMITLCASCHATVHRSQSIRHWLPEALVVLWVEQHPGRPEQLQLPIAA
jgi:hypothetical protein